MARISKNDIDSAHLFLDAAIESYKKLKPQPALAGFYHDVEFWLAQEMARQVFDAEANRHLENQ